MALVNPNIAMSYRGVEIPQQNMLADYAAIQQIQGGQRQAEVSQMQIDKMRREENALDQMMAGITAKGGPSDPMVAADLMIKSKIPHFMDAGFKLQEAARQRAEDRIAMGFSPTGATPAAAAAAAPVSEAYPGYNESIGMPAPTNALAPTAATPVAPVNAMAPTAAAAPVNAITPNANKDAQIMQAKQMLLSTNPGVRIAGEQQLKALTSEAPDAALMKQLGYPLTQAGYQAFRDAQRQERMLTPEEEKQRIRIANASRPPPAPVQPRAATITTVEDPNNPGKFLQVDANQYKGGGAGSPGVIGGARPSATAEKVAAQKVQLGKDLGFAITQLDEVTKDGGLIDQSTGSGAGRLVDIGAGFVGKATPGAIAIGKLAPIADLVLKMVPRFEGPQSDKDTKSYKEAAGQLADPTLPTEIRKAAGKTVLRLMRERKNQFVTTDMATEGTPAAAGVAPPAGFTPDQ